MRKVILSVIAIGLFAIEAFSQQRVFSCAYEGSVFERLSTTIIPDRGNGIFIISMITDRSVKRYIGEKEKSIPLLEQHISVFTPDTEFPYHHVIDDKFITTYRRLVFAAGIYRNKKIIEVLRNRMNADMYIFETDLVTGITKVTDTIKSRRHEILISCFDRNKALNIVTFTDGTNNLNIYQKSDTGLKKTLLDLVLPGDGKDRSNSVTTLSKRHFGVFENNQRYHVLFTAAWNKTFLQHDRLVLTLTDKNADVYAVIIHIDSPSYYIKKFKPVTEIDGRKVKSTSAFLVDSLLVTTYANDKKLYLNIFNLHTEQLLLSEIIDESNIEKFWTGPIQRTGSFMSKSDMKEAAFSKFYATVKNNELSVSAYVDKGKLFLSFGADYRQIINGTTLLNAFTTIGGTYLINTSSDSYGYFISGFQGVQNSTYTSFDATLSLDELKPVAAALILQYGTG